MNTARLLRLFGEVDERFVDATPIAVTAPKARACVRLKRAAIVACAALMACLAACAVHEAIRFPAENAPYVPPKAPLIMISAPLGVDQPYTYATLADESDAVIVADVAEVAPSNVMPSYNHDVTVTVKEVLKGDVSAGDSVTVVETTTHFFEHEEGVPRMEAGNRVLLFLVTSHHGEDEESGVYYLFKEHPTLGCFYYDSDGRYHEALTYGERFPSLVHTKLFCDYTPKTLEEIKEAIAE